MSNKSTPDSRQKKLLLKVRLEPSLYREFIDSVPYGTRNAVVNQIIRAFLDGRLGIEK